MDLIIFFIFFTNKTYIKLNISYSTVALYFYTLLCLHLHHECGTCSSIAFVMPLLLISVIISNRDVFPVRSHNNHLSAWPWPQELTQTDQTRLSDVSLASTRWVCYLAITWWLPGGYLAWLTARLSDFRYRCATGGGIFPHILPTNDYTLCKSQETMPLNRKVFDFLNTYQN